MERLLFVRKKRKRKREFIEFLDSRTSRFNDGFLLSNDCRFIFLLFVHIQRDILEGKVLPSELTIYSQYFRENIFIKKSCPTKNFSIFMVNDGAKQKHIALLFSLIEVWKILVIARCRVAKVKKKERKKIY